MKHHFEAVVIGTSAGGLNALEYIIPQLPKKFIPIIIVMHLMNNSGNFLVPYFSEKSKIKVKEAQCHEVIEQNVVYFAPAGYHLQIEYDHTLSLSVDEPVNYSRPSIDVLFESAAIAYQDALIGVLLTGANSDGSHGFEVIKKHGGMLVVQDPKTAVAPEMPNSAINLCAVDHVLELEKIASFLIEITL